MFFLPGSRVSIFGGVFCLLKSRDIVTKQLKCGKNQRIKYHFNRKRPHLRSGAICVGCGGLATFMAPGRGTYGSVWSAPFQRCKGRAKVLKWRQMRAFSGYLTGWCGRAVAARLLPQQPPSGRFLPGSCPVPVRFLPDNRAAPASASVGRLLRRSRAATGRTTLGCCTTLVRMIPTTHTIPLRNLNQNQNTG
jgi:hypothetical protein